MMPSIALCVDSESMKQPALIGLSGENLAAQDWLVLYTSADEARSSLLVDAETDEVWVASSDDMDPINLAAAVKRDRRERGVYLLAFQGTGSLWSRAHAAGIDATFSHQAFLERYRREKRRRGSARVSGGLPIAASPDIPVDGIDVFADAGCARASEEGKGGSDGGAEGSAAPSGSGEALRGAATEAALPAESMPSARNERVLVASEALNAAETVRMCAQTEPIRLDASAPASQRAFLLPVASGSGGAGKSTVAVLAAVLAHRLGHRTLLLDFDLQFGDMREMLGAPDALAVDEGLAAPARLARLASEGGKPALLAAPRRLEAYEAIAGEASALLDCLMPRFDVIVANTGAAWREEHAVLLERSSKALFLVDQRASSLRACKHAVELCARCGIATSPFVFVANRCAKGSLFSSIDVSCAMQGARAAELRDGGREVEDLLEAGMPLDLVEERNDLCASLEQLLAEILPASAQVEKVRESAGSDESRGLFRKRRSRRRRGAQ